MSDIVKLGSALPGDFEVNGLDAIVDDLLDNPKELRAAFVIFDVFKENVDIDKDTRVPVVRVRRFEPLGSADDVSKAVKEAYFQAVEDRTGKKALPLEYAEVVEGGDGGSNVVQAEF